MLARTLTTFFLLAAASAVHAQIETYAYAEINGRPLELDFRRPPAAGAPAPLIVWIHGGGWAGGERNFPGFSRDFLDDGYAFATIDYRLTTQSDQWGGASVTWPAQAHDCKAAIRWLRAHADDLNIDPCAIITWGSSAGGHLSAIMGASNDHAFLEGTVGDFDATPSTVQLAVDYYGPTDLLFMDPDVTHPPGSTIEHDGVRSPESRLLGSDDHGISIGEIREHLGDPAEPWATLTHLAWTAAPAQLARHAASNVPMFIAHGQQDTTVPYNQSVRLLQALTNAGTEATLLPVPDAGHGLPRSVALEVKAWLDARRPTLGCACPADIDADGALTVFDFLEFQNLFATGSPAADFDGDGELTFFDFLAFQTAFATGCD
ncbi:hypothetical protein AY599_15035 [Leptolyngbya valderiana BDU 20041]|nr:hypothetical protein AY599_15035 [Leptolyngbya valderiana BDU 20041]